jgi:hypothetical protein
MAGFSVYDFNDTEILTVLDTAGGGGGLPAVDLSKELGARDDVKGHGMGVRLGFMRKWGMVNQDPKDKVWMVTPGGARVLESRRLATAKKMIQDLPEEEMVEVMAFVCSLIRKQRTERERMLGKMLMREFRFGTDLHSRIWGAVRRPWGHNANPHQQKAA